MAWTRLRSHKHEDYTVAKTREDIVRDPAATDGGSEYPRFIIECPDWCNIIPVTKDGKLVMVRQFRFGAWQQSLELPGGIVDPGEDPKAAATRELAEETGYRPREVIALGSVHPNPAFQGNRCHSFLALDCEPGTARPEAGEDLEVVLIDRASVPERIRSGEISHALIVSALFLEQMARR